MGAYHRVLSLALAAASVNNICLSQSTGAPANLLINGAAASGGVATLDVARQVLFTFAANETGHNFTITGTNINGTVQTEVVAGTATTAVTLYDYKTITRIAVSAATTGNLTVGTNGVASTVPMIIDRFIAAPDISASVVISGTINFSVQVSYDDLAPDWDIVATPPTWFDPPNTPNLTSKTANAADDISMPITMIRLHQNSFSSGGTAALTVNVPMRFA